MASMVPWFRKEGDAFSTLQKSMNALFEDFFQGGAPAVMPAFSRSGWVPSMDVAEDEESFKVTAELPGMTEKDIQLTVNDHAMLLRGEKKEEKEEKKKNWYRMERTYGAFERTLPLPVEVEAEKATATFKNGVLNVLLPKSPKAKEQHRKIEIKAQ
ncbi:MAG: Hsp20/alpha crystallin family protein [Acidobacteriota bacterium]